MPVVDLHAHIVVPEVVEAMQRRRPDLAPRLVEIDGQRYFERPGGRRSGIVPPPLIDVEHRLQDMDRLGVDVQVVSVLPPNYFYEATPEVGALFSRLQNDGMAEFAGAQGGRFEVFGNLPLQDVDATLAEIGRIVAVPAIRGVQIGTHVDGVGLDAASLDPVWEALAASDLPVWLHPDWQEIAKLARLGDYHLRNLIGNPLESTMAMAALIFSGVLDRYPSLRVGFVHGGGFAPYQLGRWDHGWGCREEARAHIGRPPSDYLRSMWFDSLTHGGPSLRFLGELVGWDRVVLGSDYPADMASPDPVGAVRALALPDEVERGVLGANAQRFLRG